MSKKPLSEKEKAFFDKLLDYYIGHLNEPTREELASFMSISPQMVEYYTKQIKSKGYLIREKKSRLKINE